VAQVDASLSLILRFTQDDTSGDDSHGNDMFASACFIAHKAVNLLYKM